MIEFIPFFLLAAVFALCWVFRGSRERGVLIALAIAAGFFAGYLDWIALAVVIGWGALWLVYAKQQNPILFILLVCLSFGFKLHLFPGFSTWQITDKFWMGFDSPLVGLFPLAFLVPLASNAAQWKQVGRGWQLALGGIAAMTCLALLGGTVHWGPHLPTFAGYRYFANFFLTAIPEEAFYRGFVQGEIARIPYKGAKWLALFASSVIFTIAHIGWSPNPAIFAFVFLAGLLYGGVYWISGRIESSILCHFLLNFIHMTFFSYHAM